MIMTEENEENKKDLITETEEAKEDKTEENKN